MTDAAPQWVPTDDDIANARVTDFARFVQERTGAPTDGLPVAVAVVGRRSRPRSGRAMWDYFELGDRPERRARERGDARGAMVPRRPR